MNALYIETSSVLSWLLGEKHADAVRHTIDEASTVVTSGLTLLEANRALIRHLGQGGVKEADARRAIGALTQLAADWTIMEISESVRNRAGQSFPHEPVRSLDAVHLATALEFASAFSKVTVLSFDERVRINAQMLGLSLAD
jgi:predicted nucleic acid-binding protein